MLLMDKLVHISAPTTRQDDERFVNQATAYSGFRLAKSHDILKSRTSTAKGTTFASNNDSRRTDSNGKTVRLLDRQRPGLQKVWKVGSRGLGIHHSSEFSPEDKRTIGPSCSTNFRIVNAHGRSPYYTTPVHAENTQQMFDTQYAAAGIESQISTVSNDDSPVSSTDSERPSKRQRRSHSEGCDVRHSRLQNILMAGEDARSHVSSQSMGAHSSSKGRRDSQRTEAISPTIPPKYGNLPLVAAQSLVQAVSELSKVHSPSAATGAQIADSDALCQSQPQLFNTQGLDIDRFKNMVSSILPDTYDLSKSGSDSKHDNLEEGRYVGPGSSSEPKANSLNFHHYNSVTDALPAQSKCQQPTRNKLLGDYCHAPSIEEIPAITEKVSPREIRRVPQVNAQVSQPRRQPEHMPHTKGRHNPYPKTLSERNSGVSMPQPAMVANNPTITAHNPSLNSSQIAGSVVAPQRVQRTSEWPHRPPCDRPRTSSKVRAYDVAPMEKLRTVSQKQPEIAQPEASLLEAVRGIPHQIFPDPDPEGLGSGATSSQDISKSRTHSALLMEKHGLYRRVIHRVLQPLERGYWTFTIKSWALAIRIQFLHELRVYLEKRTAGQSPWAEVHFDGHGLPEQVDMYCAVEELGDVWQFLYVLSERKLAQQNMYWIGWDGGLAVTMPAKLWRS